MMQSENEAGLCQTAPLLQKPLIESRIGRMVKSPLMVQRCEGKNPAICSDTLKQWTLDSDYTLSVPRLHSNRLISDALGFSHHEIEKCPGGWR